MAYWLPHVVCIIFKLLHLEFHSTVDHTHLMLHNWDPKLFPKV
ncbi:hypothetical protein Gotur_006311 [Gossypium turneri]